jgi:two-component sensor histidine kinase
MLQTPIPLPASVFITDELAARPSTTANYLQEKRALQQLAASMVERPGEILPEFVALAMELTDAVSAGLSLYEPGPDAGVFRWHHVAGSLAIFEGATTPRQYSPCGVTLDARAPVLTRHAETLYTWIADAGIVVPEVLLVPLYIDGSVPHGTLWMVSDRDGHFNAGHARIASELAAFVGIALRIQQTDQRLREALDEQATLTREMNHRVKNVFALTDSMIRFSARGEGTKAEMASLLSGRLHALADAHSLVMAGLKGGTEKSDLRTLLETILRPHAADKGPARFVIDGPEVACGPRAVNGLSLVFHELATNAAKYGALSSESGAVNIVWAKTGTDLEIVWTEQGGRTVDGPPDHRGFGSKLVETTIMRQMKGLATYDWLREGLKVSVSVPLNSLVD